MARILVVEDDLESRLLIAIILQRAGYETREVENGTEALYTLEKDPLINLVISDVLMPEMNGLQFLEQAKQLYPTLPIILLTAHLRSEWVDQATQKGAICYLLKPVTQGQLMTVVGDILSFSQNVEECLDYLSLPYA
jgi:two-component system, NtrC family, response regulator GlrR